VFTPIFGSRVLKNFSLEIFADARHDGPHGSVKDPAFSASFGCETSPVLWRDTFFGTFPFLKPLIKDASFMTGNLDFEALVSQFYASLYQFAFSLTRSESDACDLTQETFYIWAAKGHQLKDTKKVKSWLFTTLHREFLESHRRQSRFPHHELEEASPELPVMDLDLVSHLDGAKVVQLLAEIDPQYQAPVALFYLEDLPYKDISEILNIPLGTVKSRISRGIAQMQLLLSKAPRMMVSARKVAT
jgi:RNA polymerase sigma-70 factor (ECF subfamily)